MLLASAISPGRVFPGEEGPVLVAAGVKFLEAGDYKKAHEELYQTFLKEPENPEVNFQLGRAAFGLGDYEAAVMAFDRAIINDPGRIAARLELARSFLKLGALDTARQHCNEMLRGNPPPELRTNIETLLREIP